MPPSLSDFPDEVQAAFFIHSILPDKIDSMAGYHYGKEISGLKDIIELYSIKHPEIVCNFFFYITNKLSESINKKIKRQRDAESRKAGGNKPPIATRK